MTLWENLQNCREKYILQLGFRLQRGNLRVRDLIHLGFGQIHANVKRLLVVALSRRERVCS